MEKHAVPQNIMDFEFKLIAGLTVKQFGTLAISFMTALLIYVVIPIPLISYPIIAVIIVLGLTMTFMKINEQPFSVWFINFIKNLFISQRRVYQKDDNEFRLLEDDSSVKVNLTKDMSDPLLRVKKQNPNPDNFVQNIADPNLKDFSNNSHIRVSGVEVSDIVSDDRMQKLDNYFEEAVRTHKNKNSKFASVGNIQKPEVEKIEVDATELEQKPLEEKFPKENVKEDIESDQRLTTNKKRFKLPFQNAPQSIQKDEAQVNQVIGFITDKQGKPLEGASIVIYDAQTKQPVAEANSQNNGKFIVSNSLKSGEYELGVKLDGYNFPTFQLKLEDKLVPIYRYQATN